MFVTLFFPVESPEGSFQRTLHWLFSLVAYPGDIWESYVYLLVVSYESNYNPVDHGSKSRIALCMDSHTY